MVIGIHLENVYNLVHYSIINYLYKKKKKINEILENGYREIDDYIKDKPDKTE